MKLSFDKKSLLALFIFVVLAVIAFRCNLGEGKIFSATDSNIGLIARSKSVPLGDSSGYFFSVPVFGSVSAKVYTFSGILLNLSSEKVFNNWRYALFLIISSVAIFRFIRGWGIRFSGALLGAIISCWVGFMTLASAGHDGKFGTQAFFSLSLLCVEQVVKAETVRRRICHAILCGGAIGLMLLEQQDVGLLFGVVLGPYALFRLAQLRVRWTGWLSALLPMAVVALLLAGGSAIASYTKNVTEASSVQSGEEDKWDFVTQWSLPPSEIPDMVMPGLFGWKTGDGEAPYWGRIGQSAEWEMERKGFRNFKLDSFYLGFVPLFLAFCGGILVLRGERDRGKWGWTLFWCSAAVITLFLSFGKFTPIYRVFYALPLVNNIRAPIKFLQMFQICIGILAAVGWDALAAQRGNKRVMVATIVASVSFALIGAFGWIGVQLGGASLLESMRVDGWGHVSDAIVANMKGAFVHTVVVGLLLGGALWWMKRRAGQGAVKLLWILLAAIVLFDMVGLSRRFYHTVPEGGLKEGHYAIHYLKQHQGNERIFFFDPGHVYNQWLAMDVPYHDLHVFNIFQMSRMPQDYKDFFASVGGNWHRMLQLSSVKYGVGPAVLASQIPPTVAEPVAYFGFAQHDGGIITVPLQNGATPNAQVILRMKQTLPRFALFESWEKMGRAQAFKRIGANDFNPLKTVLVASDAALVEAGEGGEAHRSIEPAKVTKSSVLLKVLADNPAVLLFTQHYQAGWRVLWMVAKGHCFVVTGFVWGFFLKQVNMRFYSKLLSVF